MLDDDARRDALRTPPTAAQPWFRIGGDHHLRLGDDKPIALGSLSNAVVNFVM
jgi:hypothetical protein